MSILRKTTNITSLSGCSIGALVAYSLSYSHVDPTFAQEMFSKYYPKGIGLSISTSLKGIFSRKSVCDISILRTFICNFLNSINVPFNITLKEAFERSNIPVSIVTSDISLFKPVLHTYLTNDKDTVLDLISASMCYPLAFPPVKLKIDESLHYDGGMLGEYINTHIKSDTCSIPVTIRFSNSTTCLDDRMAECEREYVMKNTWEETPHFKILKHFTFRINQLFSTPPLEDELFIHICMPDTFTVFSTMETVSKTDLESSIYNTQIATIKALHKINNHKIPIANQMIQSIKSI